MIWVCMNSWILFTVLNYFQLLRLLKGDESDDELLEDSILDFDEF